MTKVLDDKIDEMLDKNEIVEVDSPYNIPILLTHHNSENKHIAFEDRKFRLCLDLRAVNSLTMLKNKDSHMVKSIEHLYGRVYGCDTFTVADMTKAYRSLPAAFHLRQICAFRTPDSTKYPFHVWAFRSTPDGLAILPGFYSLCLQKCLSARSRACVIQHIDDLLICSKGPERHLEDLESVFGDLLKGNFLVSVPKLKLFKKEVSFLGHVLNGETLEIPAERKSYFDSLKPPTTKKEMQSLLGVAGYMAHFVDSYHLKTGLLFESLKGKNDKQSFTLNHEQMLAFEELRKSIKEAEKLYIVDFDKPIYMEVDASLTGTGSVLYQEYPDPDAPPGSPPKRRIIRYGSRRFSITESLHHTSLEREAMAILIGCKTHFYYLSNCVEAIIKTDLKSLITLLSCYQNPDSASFARASHRLYSLGFKWSLIHVAGVDLPLADALSRLHPPYRCAFSDRHLRYPDLEREYIQIPEEWKKTPNLVLTTADIIKAMKDKIVFVDKTSMNVRKKRLNSYVNELHLLKKVLGSRFDTLNEQVHSELQHIELSAKEHNQKGQLNTKRSARIPAQEEEGFDQVDILALEVPRKMTSVSSRVLITPTFISKHQNEDPKLNSIILHLKTTPRGQLKAKLVKVYRLLNDTILCTRKNKRLPFHAPGNLRIVCSSKMTLIIMSILHIMGGHYGINTLSRLFALTYKVKGSITSFAKIVALGCRACRLHRPTNKRNIPMGRIPIPSEPNHTWHMDHVIWKKESVLVKGKRYEGALNIVDLYSNLLISHLVTDVKAETTIECLKQTFSIMPAPVKIVSDNATGLCANTQVAKFLKSKGVRNITTITPYNSKGNKTERMNKILRETLQLVRETFKRRTPYEMYSTVIEMINSRPLSVVNHPHIRNMTKNGTDVITPFSLHYGQKPQIGPLIALEDELDPQTKNDYKLKWQRILAEHDRLLQQELNERNKLFEEKEGIQVGDLVLKINRADHQHKENIKYTRNLYEVTEIQKSKFTIRPLFSSTAGTLQVNGQDLKPYNYSELFSLLPPDIRDLMGESLKPEDLKNQATNDATKVPKDFQNWGLIRIPPGMKLRNKLTPASLASVPAISMSNSNTITETRTTMTFSSDDGYSEHSRESEASSPKPNPFIRPPRPLVVPSPLVKQPLTSPVGRKINPPLDYHQTLEDESLSESRVTEASQLKTTEDGVVRIQRKQFSYLPPPEVKRAFPVGRTKPLAKPGPPQRKQKRVQMTPMTSIPSIEREAVPVIETIPLPFRHQDRDVHFFTSTPNPSSSNSENMETLPSVERAVIETHAEPVTPSPGEKTTRIVRTVFKTPCNQPQNQEEINKISILEEESFETPDLSVVNENKSGLPSVLKDSDDSAKAILNPPDHSLAWDYGFMNLGPKDKTIIKTQENASINSSTSSQENRKWITPPCELDSSPEDFKIQDVTPPSDLSKIELESEDLPMPGDENILDVSPPLGLYDTIESAIQSDEESLEDVSKITSKPLEREFKDMYKISGILPGDFSGFTQEDLDVSLPEDVIKEITSHEQSRKTVFADQHGFPLAEDNDGQRLRLSQKYEKYKIKPKHVPFSKPPSSGSAESNPETTIKPVTTRSGRVVKKPQMLGEWVTDSLNDTNQSEEKPKDPVIDSSPRLMEPGHNPPPLGLKPQRLVGIEHPQYQTPTFSRFQPQKVIKTPKTVISPAPPGVRTETKTPSKNSPQNPQPQGLLRGTIPPNQQQQQIPDDIHLGDSPPRLRRTTRERKPPSKYGFED